MSLLLALTGATPPSNSQELAVTLEGIDFVVVQAKQQTQALGVTLDDIGVSIVQVGAEAQPEGGGGIFPGYAAQVAKKVKQKPKTAELITKELIAQVGDINYKPDKSIARNERKAAQLAAELQALVDLKLKLTIEADKQAEQDDEDAVMAVLFMLD